MISNSRKKYNLPKCFLITVSILVFLFGTGCASGQSNVNTASKEKLLQPEEISGERPEYMDTSPSWTQEARIKRLEEYHFWGNRTSPATVKVNEYNEEGKLTLEIEYTEIENEDAVSLLPFPMYQYNEYDEESNLKIKSVYRPIKAYEYVYDRQGNVEKVYAYNPAGLDFIRRYEYQYDEGGRILSCDSYDSYNFVEGEAYEVLVDRDKYEYDEHGNKTAHYNDNNFYTYEYEYDADGRITACKELGGFCYEYHYDAKGNRKDSYTYAADGSLIGYTEYKYDDQGVLRQQCDYLSNQSPDSEFHYDEIGNLTATYSFDNGNKRINERYQYQFDADANMMVECQYNSKDVLKRKKKITYYPYQVIESEYMLDNGYCFTNFQVCGMKDKKLEGRVNESLNKYFYILDGYWFNEETTKQMSNIVHFQSERYLSVEYIFKYDSPFYTKYWHFCVTVDMQTGEVVFLDDLIELDEDFGRLVRSGNILKGTGKSQSYNAAGELVEKDTWDSPSAITADEQTEGYNELFQRADPSYAIRWFDDYTRERLYGAYLEELDNEEERLYRYTWLYHYYFYLEDGEIHFSTGGFQTRTDDIAFWTSYISVDDIEECLKVPKW